MELWCLRKRVHSFQAQSNSAQQVAEIIKVLENHNEDKFDRFLQVLHDTGHTDVAGELYAQVYPVDGKEWDEKGKSHTESYM